MNILTSLLKIMISIIVIAVLILAYLELQQRMIYHPRPYDVSYKTQLSKVIPIEYETGQGKQTAYYYKGNSKVPPKNLWVFFCGNKSLAMDWFDRLLNNYKDISSGFLLFDYPGFGKCEGKPNPKRIRKSADKAIETLYERYESLNMKAKTQLNVLGHSLGAAIALDFAARHPCKRVILLAPFTSLSDMARRVVGAPLCYALSHKLDNHDKLLEIAQQAPQPVVYLIHGSNDAVIPVEMGKKLSKSFSSLVRYVELPFADHSSVISLGREKIYQAMDGQRNR